MNKRKAPTGPVKFVNAIFALVFANVVLANRECSGRVPALSTSGKPVWCAALGLQKKCVKAYTQKPNSGPRECMWKSAQQKCVTGNSCTTECAQIDAFGKGIITLGQPGDCRLGSYLVAGSTCNVKCDESKGFSGGMGTYRCAGWGAPAVTSLKCTTIPTTTASTAATTTTSTMTTTIPTTTTTIATTTSTTTKITTVTTAPPTTTPDVTTIEPTTATTTTTATTATTATTTTVTTTTPATTTTVTTTTITTTTSTATTASTTTKATTKSSTTATTTSLTAIFTTTTSTTTVKTSTTTTVTTTSSTTTGTTATTTITTTIATTVTTTTTTASTAITTTSTAANTVTAETTIATTTPTPASISITTIITSANMTLSSPVTTVTITDKSNVAGMVQRITNTLAVSKPNAYAAASATTTTGFSIATDSDPTTNNTKTTTLFSSAIQQKVLVTGTVTADDFNAFQTFIQGNTFMYLLVGAGVAMGVFCSMAVCMAIACTSCKKRERGGVTFDIPDSDSENYFVDAVVSSDSLNADHTRSPMGDSSSMYCQSPLPRDDFLETGQYVSQQFEQPRPLNLSSISPRVQDMHAETCFPHHQPNYSHPFSQYLPTSNFQPFPQEDSPQEYGEQQEYSSRSQPQEYSPQEQLGQFAHESKNSDAFAHQYRHSHHPTNSHPFARFIPTKYLMSHRSRQEENHVQRASFADVDDTYGDAIMV